MVQMWLITEVLVVWKHHWDTQKHACWLGKISVSLLEALLLGFPAYRTPGVSRQAVVYALGLEPPQLPLPLKQELAG